MMSLIIILFSLITALVTFEFAKFKIVGAIRASSAVTLLSLIDLNIINHFYTIDINMFLAVIFGASFVGMSSALYFSRLHIICASIIYGILFVFLIPLLSGIGGALGFSAFISVLLVKPFVKQQKIQLRGFELTDEKFVIEILQDERVMKSTGFKRVQTLEESMSRLESWVHDKEVWCVTLNDQTIGWGMLKQKEGKFEVGYMLLHQFWGRGYGLNIAKSLCEMNTTDQLTAKVEINNIASAKILDKLNFIEFERNNELIHYVNNQSSELK